MQHIEETLFLNQPSDEWKKIYEQFSTVTNEVEIISKQRSFIQNLRYDKMQIRSTAIVEAYPRTYEWILKPGQLSSSDPRMKIKYVQWLRAGSGIFWVTGKPGM
jgi:hypothetical protein